ncbi:MAG TPA: methylenetetrahydrofolate reductase C-terminal domain-containing protein [Chloroflexota bacterium]|nr:methylenetetrahydrofolate reductase C-terminal domain-containing protein [Chloroflexota bacterium]
MHSPFAGVTPRLRVHRVPRRTPAARAAVPNAFRATLASAGSTTYAVELAPTAARLERLYRFAEQARGAGVTLFLTDGAGGHDAPSPDATAADLARLMNRQPVVTVACKHATRQALLTRLGGLEERGLENALIVTGDFPRAPDARQRGPFPLDSVSLLLAATRGAAGPAVRAWLGATVNPFRYAEAEVWGQRIKAWKKWRAGAAYLVAQIGYDVLKLQELRLWLARDGMAEVPALASVHVLHRRTVGLLRGGRLPGVYLPPDLEEGAARLDLAAAHRRAALLADVAVRGLGYRGVLFGGVERYEHLAAILAIKDELAARDWRESYEEYRHAPPADPSAADPGTAAPISFAPPGAYYLFPAGSDALLAAASELAGDRPPVHAPRALRWVHDAFFSRGAPGAALAAHAACAALSLGLAPAVARVERAIKGPLLGCRLCGDCRIPAFGYRCPVDGCPKGLLNGPCAGARADGSCEVDPARECFWRPVVGMALAAQQLEPLYLAQPPRQPALQGTSSWINHFAGLTAPAAALGAIPVGTPVGTPPPPQPDPRRTA